MAKATVLHDYQGVALDSAAWGPANPRVPVEAVLDRWRESEIVVAMRERTQFPAEVLRELPALRLLVTTGMKNAAIDLAAASEHGITVCGTSASGGPVPEITMGMIIALARNFAVEDAAVRAGGWQHTIGRGLAGSTLGV